MRWLRTPSCDSSIPSRGCMASVEPATITERVLRLRRTPHLSRLATGDLELLAYAGREIVCATRTTLVPADELASALYVPLTGRLKAMRNGQVVAGELVREFYGGTALLSDSVITADVIAEAGTILFVLDRDALFAVLEEHGTLQRTLLRILSERVIELRGSEFVTSGKRMEESPRGFPSSDLLRRIRLLRDSLGLESRSLPVLAQLARAALVRRFPAGEVVWEPADGQPRVVIVVQGALDVSQSDLIAARVRPGESVGMTEAVAGARLMSAGKAVEETVTVELSGPEMQEAIDDHDDFCQDLTRAMAYELHRRTFRDLVGSHA